MIRFQLLRVELQAEKMRRFFNNFLKVDGDEKQDVLIVVEEDLVLVYRLVREVSVYMKNKMSDELSVHFYLSCGKLVPDRTFNGILWFHDSVSCRLYP